MNYWVSTQHRDCGAEFITPVQVEADSPREAAQLRLSWLVDPEDVSALLVRKAGLTYPPAWVFTTKRSVDVADAPERLGVRKEAV